MRISISGKGLRETAFHEFAARFLFGGAMTVMAGLIAKKFGPAVGGLFLAFPAIFPASATLVEKHERKRKREAGLAGQKRGTDAAGADAAGASIGSLGLISFAAVLAVILPKVIPGVALSAAFVVWLIVSLSGWFLWKRFR